MLAPNTPPPIIIYDEVAVEDMTQELPLGTRKEVGIGKRSERNNGAASIQLSSNNEPFSMPYTDTNIKEWEAEKVEKKRVGVGSGRGLDA